MEAGLRASGRHLVGVDHTATALGSGDVEVLATPQVLAWCEGATVAAVADHLEPGTTTVGMRARIDHVRATRVGGRVTVEATLERVEGRRLTFDVIAYDDDDEEIASGQVVRVIVERDRFMARVQP